MNFRKKSFILSIIVPVLILSIILGGCNSKEREEKPDNDNIVTGTGEKPAEPATDIVTCRRTGGSERRIPSVESYCS